MTAIEFDFEARAERAIDASAARAACEAGRYCWIDVDATADPAAARTVLHQMGVNEHAIDEAFGPDVDGRHDLYDDCLHVAVTSAAYADGSLSHSHVDIMIGERYLLTLRRGPVEFIDHVKRTYRQDFLKFAKTPSFLLYEYFDHLIESYKRALRGLEGQVEHVQRQIFGDVDDRIFAEAAGVTRDLLSLRKIMLGAREVLHELTSRQTPFVYASAVPSLERLAAALERLVADITVERESLAETLNLYMGIVSHRTNRVVNRLTVVSMVFLPLSFLAGVYGMNFSPDAGGSMPELGWRHGYFFFWVVAIAIAVSLLTYMKRRRWW